MASDETNGVVKKRPRLDKEEVPKHILFLTISNLNYPVTADVVQEVFSRGGTVLRVLLRVVDEGTKVRGLVEFKSVDEATHAKELLHGANIYPGCCHLYIKYAHQDDKLKVPRNSIFSWELTNDGISDGRNGQGPRSLLAPPHEGAVLRVKGLHEKINAQALFNLFGVFGDVIKVKFDVKRKGCAWIQMGDALGAERVAGRLKNLNIYGSKIKMTPTLLPYVTEDEEPTTLADGSPSFVNFMGSVNSRYKHRPSVSGDWLEPPTRRVAFYNVPCWMDKEELLSVLRLRGPVPLSITMTQEKSQRCKTGVMEFASTYAAVEAVIVANNIDLDSGDSQDKHVLKLEFAECECDCECHGKCKGK